MFRFLSMIIVIVYLQGCVNDKSKAENNVSNSESITPRSIEESIQSFTDISTNSHGAKEIHTTPDLPELPNPMAGIREIEAPGANPSGAAVFSYPFVIPEGINGLTPDLAIVYNSDDHHKGNAGAGWNLDISAIKIKTGADGVPKYDGEDTLLLDGEELVRISRSSTVEQYRFRAEGRFWWIEKIKNDGTPYFAAKTSEGLTYYYGKTEESRLDDPDNSTRVYAWYLSKVEDRFGNELLYHYTKEVDNNTRTNDLKYRIHTINSITYGPNNSYKIDFKWRIGADVTSSALTGFFVKNTNMLNYVVISNNNTALR